MTPAALVLALLELVEGPRTDVLRARAELVAPIILAEAQQAGLDPVLLGAMAWRESRWRQSARGERGEVGVFQVLPSTAAALCPGLRIVGLEHNVRCAAIILSWLRGRCRSVERALGAWNGGGCRVSAYARRVMSTARRARPAGEGA